METVLNSKNRCSLPHQALIQNNRQTSECLTNKNSVVDGLIGGEKAAHALQDEIQNHLQEAYPGIDTSSWGIMVVVIASMDALGWAYDRVLKSDPRYPGVNFTAQLRQFSYGFNRGARGTFSFIDVGAGNKLKELTDTKLKETFLLSMLSTRTLLLIHQPTNSIIVIISSVPPLSSCLLCRLPRLWLCLLSQPLQARPGGRFEVIAY